MVRNPYLQNSILELQKPKNTYSPNLGFFWFFPPRLVEERGIYTQKGLLIAGNSWKTPSPVNQEAHSLKSSGGGLHCYNCRVSRPSMSPGCRGQGKTLGRKVNFALSLLDVDCSDQRGDRERDRVESREGRDF